MPGQWKQVVRLQFKGERFRDHAFDLSALSELSQFQKLIAETAKSLWRAANPDRERLPKHFEGRTRLCLRQIEEGSAVAPLEVYLEEPDQDQKEFWEGEPEEPKEVSEAIEMAYQVFGAIDRNEALPDRFPRRLVSEYAKWGQTLATDEEVEFVPAGKTEPVRVSVEHRQRLETYAAASYEDAVNVEGEVFEADVRQRKFQLWRDAQNAVTVSFDEQQEEMVTTALKEHRSLHIRVVGRGEYSPEGQLLKVTRVDHIETVQPQASEFDVASPNIEDILSVIAAQVPAEEWNKLPSDLSSDLDHYLYGTPRK
jgi:hypothetical protein